jgi:hypothetical protein
MVVNDNAGESDAPQRSPVHREQARSYKGMAVSANARSHRGLAVLTNARSTTKPVGASLLAMVVNDNAGNLMPRAGLQFIVGTPPGASSLL